jgi:hypothetical protein
VNVSPFIAVLIGVLPVIVTVVGIVFAHAMSALRERMWLESSGEPFAVLSMALAFDSDHALVWETQAPILQLVSEAGWHGISTKRVREAYRESARHYPEIYDGFTFQQWLKFLEDAQLVARTGKHALLTSKGRDFLHYRISADVRTPVMISK